MSIICYVDMSLTNYKVSIFLKETFYKQIYKTTFFKHERTIYYNQNGFSGFLKSKSQRFGEYIVNRFGNVWGKLILILKYFYDHKEKGDILKNLLKIHIYFLKHDNY